MPKSKRDQVVSLTAVRRPAEGARALKRKTMEGVHEALDQYQAVYLFTHQNFNTAVMKELRMAWSDSRFLFGKNKVLALALGPNEEREYKTNLHLLSERMSGPCGLMFTDRDEEEVLRFFEEFSVPHFATAGIVSPEEVLLPAGDLPYQHTMEVFLRELEMPVSLVNGVVRLDKPYRVCKAGDILNSRQCKILRLFGHKLGRFQLRLLCGWRDEKVKVFGDSSVGASSSRGMVEDGEEDEEEFPRASSEEEEEEEVEVAPRKGGKRGKKGAANRSAKASSSRGKAGKKSAAGGRQSGRRR